MLTTTQEAIMNAIGSGATLDDIRRRTHMPRERVHDNLIALVKKGYLDSSDQGLKNRGVTKWRKI